MNTPDRLSDRRVVPVATALVVALAAFLAWQVGREPMGNVELNFSGGDMGAPDDGPRSPFADMMLRAAGLSTPEEEQAKVAKDLRDCIARRMEDQGMEGECTLRDDGDGRGWKPPDWVPPKSVICTYYGPDFTNTRSFYVGQIMKFGSAGAYDWITQGGMRPYKSGMYEEVYVAASIARDFPDFHSRFGYVHYLPLRTGDGVGYPMSSVEWDGPTWEDVESSGDDLCEVAMEQLLTETTASISPEEAESFSALDQSLTDLGLMFEPLPDNARNVYFKPESLHGERLNCIADAYNDHSFVHCERNPAIYASDGTVISPYSSLTWPFASVSRPDDYESCGGSMVGSDDRGDYIVPALECEPSEKVLHLQDLPGPEWEEYRARACTYYFTYLPYIEDGTIATDPGVLEQYEEGCD